MNRKLLIWDIDGTLVDCGSAGRKAMDRTFKELFHDAPKLLQRYPSVYLRKDLNVNRQLHIMPLNHHLLNRY